MSAYFKRTEHMAKLKEEARQFRDKNFSSALSKLENADLSVISLSPDEASVLLYEVQSLDQDRDDIRAELHGAETSITALSDKLIEVNSENKALRERLNAADEAFEAVMIYRDKFDE